MTSSWFNRLRRNEEKSTNDIWKKTQNKFKCCRHEIFKNITNKFVNKYEYLDVMDKMLEKYSCKKNRHKN